MKKLNIAVSLLVVAAFVLVACGGGATEAPKDLLGQIMARGTLVVSTDPNYAPQSVAKPDGKRTEGTKCASDQLTAGELEGFDVDVALELGKRLGVETCFVTPGWDLITAGSWADKWDISVGSMTITTGRQQVLHFTSPYYYTPAQFAAAADSGIASLDDIANQPVCVGVATTYESYLNKKFDDLGLPESSIYAQPPEGVTVIPLTSDQDCAQSIGAGRTDFQVYLTSGTVVDQNIASGVPVVKVGSPVYSEDLSVAIDKSHSLDPTSLVSKLDEAVKAMHTDGTLAKLSNQWFGIDLTQAPNK
ncbi:MAG: transporter substrate-binding domain-containing protein [Chloroflexi bacterium]|nr:transporter substrate-binding domain-containing protein [Chloroflexota bacterium]